MGVNLCADVKLRKGLEIRYGTGGLGGEGSSEWTYEQGMLPEINMATEEDEGRCS